MGNYSGEEKDFLIESYSRMFDIEKSKFIAPLGTVEGCFRPTSSEQGRENGLRDGFITVEHMAYLRPYVYLEGNTIIFPGLKPAHCMGFGG